MARFRSSRSRRSNRGGARFSRRSTGRRYGGRRSSGRGRGGSVVTHRLVIETPAANQVTPASLADRFAANIEKQKQSRQRF